MGDTAAYIHSPLAEEERVNQIIGFEWSSSTALCDDCWTFVIALQPISTIKPDVTYYLRRKRECLLFRTIPH